MKERNGSVLIRLLVILGSIAAILTAAALLYSRYNSKKRSKDLSMDYDCFDDDCDDCGCCCDGSCFNVEDDETGFDLGEEDDEEPEDILSF